MPFYTWKVFHNRAHQFNRLEKQNTSRYGRAKFEYVEGARIFEGTRRSFGVRIICDNVYAGAIIRRIVSTFSFFLKLRTYYTSLQQI